MENTTVKEILIVRFMGRKLNMSFKTKVLKKSEHEVNKITIQGTDPKENSFEKYELFKTERLILKNIKNQWKNTRINSIERNSFIALFTNANTPNWGSAIIKL